MGKVRKRILTVVGILTVIVLCVACAKKSDAEKSDAMVRTETDSKEDQNGTTTNVTEGQGSTTAQETTTQEKPADKETETTMTDNGGKGAVAVIEGDSPYALHGKLQLDGTTLTDEHGEAYQIKGVSTHGIGWFPQYVNQDTFADLKSWGADAVRLAMYTAEGGYCEGGDDNKEKLKQLIDTGVQAATKLGMYVIIDWHVLNDHDPWNYADDAEKFFAEMSEKYKDYGNVIYEICNEPNSGPDWNSVKSYAEKIIPVIRENAPDAIIIVGTPTWSQDIDKAAQNPITGYENIMYAELNTKSDYCMECGYAGEIKIVTDRDGKLVWECPNCGNRDQNKMSVARRTCGYIGTQFWNQGRTQEIKERVLHL